MFVHKTQINMRTWFIKNGSKQQIYFPEVKIVMILI